MILIAFIAVIAIITTSCGESPTPVITEVETTLETITQETKDEEVVEVLAVVAEPKTEAPTTIEPATEKPTEPTTEKPTINPACANQFADCTEEHKHIHDSYEDENVKSEWIMFWCNACQDYFGEGPEDWSHYGCLVFGDWRENEPVCDICGEYLNNCAGHGAFYCDGCEEFFVYDTEYSGKYADVYHEGMTGGYDEYHFCISCFELYAYEYELEEAKEKYSKENNYGFDSSNDPFGFFSGFMSGLEGLVGSIKGEGQYPESSYKMTSYSEQKTRLGVILYLPPSEPYFFRHSITRLNVLNRSDIYIGCSFTVMSDPYRIDDDGRDGGYGYTVVDVWVY